MLFLCDVPSWVCLLYAQVWYGEVPGAPDMEPRFIFALCYVGCSLIVVLIILHLQNQYKNRYRLRNAQRGFGVRLCLYAHHSHLTMALV